MNGGYGRNKHTFIGIIVHEGDPVDELGEGGYVLHRSTVWTGKGGILCGSGYHGTWRELLLKNFEELEHVGGIGGAFAVSLLADLTWVLPIDVDAVKIEALVDGEDVVSEGVPALWGCDCV